VQTCCIVGNYYSLRGQHARAVLYFQRALALDPSYLSAWTLLGHEFVELRATAQAIGAYRRALDINPLDYRAWYGLGQTYEILQCSKYALYYFQRAAAIKPYDARMWCAIGENYEKLAMECEASPAAVAAPGLALAAGIDVRASGLQAARLLESAIKCFQKAEGNNDPDGVALHKLAKLYRRRGQNELAAEYYRKVLRRYDADVLPQQETEDGVADMEGSAVDQDASMDGGAGGAIVPSGGGGSQLPLHADAVDAMLFLSEYHLKALGQLDVAESFCARLLDAGAGGASSVVAGAPRDLAKALLAEIRQIKGHAGIGGAGAGTAAKNRVLQQRPPPSATSTAAPTPVQQQQQSFRASPAAITPARPGGALGVAPASASPGDGSFFSSPGPSP